MAFYYVNKNETMAIMRFTKQDVHGCLRPTTESISEILLPAQRLRQRGSTIRR